MNYLETLQCWGPPLVCQVILKWKFSQLTQTHIWGVNGNFGHLSVWTEIPKLFGPNSPQKWGNIMIAWIFNILFFSFWVMSVFNIDNSLLSWFSPNLVFSRSGNLDVSTQFTILISFEYFCLFRSSGERRLLKRRNWWDEILVAVVCSNGSSCNL